MAASPIATQAAALRKRWSRVEAIVREALVQPPSERAALLDVACRGDPALRHDVTSLLDHEAAAESFLEAPAVAVAGSAMLGRQLGPYRIDGCLGAGGMGEVYRARDTVLERDVALKILSPALALTSDGLARLAREARVLATLNHPHIASIYGIEESTGVRALVLELLDGETLAERITRGRLSLAGALHLATQIADALAAAHDKGIVHRDVKPANIQITTTGKVKVLDFGIAKVAATGAPGTDVATRDGIVLGTPAYMSPEQTRGEAVGKQADVWAFGCVLFEMLSGSRAFSGATTSDTIAAVLEHEPQWSALPATTPNAVLSLLRRCLQKDMTRRLHDLSDAQLEIEEAIAARVEGRQASPADISWRRGDRRLWVTAPLALVAGIAALTLGWPSLATRDVRTVDVLADIPTPALVTDGSPQLRYFDISSDGRLLAYSQPGQGIVLRPLASAETTVLEGSRDATSVAFSPDSQQLAFCRNDRVYRISVTGGAPTEIAQVGMHPTLSWGEDDYLYFSAAVGTEGIWRVPAGGGRPERQTTVRDAARENAHVWPQLLPGGKAILYTVLGPSGGASDARVVAQMLGVDAPVVLEENAMYGRYLPSGHLLYARDDGTLYAVRFDADRLRTNGQHAAVQSGVATGFWGGGAFVVFSAAGTEVYLPRSDRPVYELLFADRKGTILGPAVDSDLIRRIGWASTLGQLSPDGLRIALNGRASGVSDIWVLDRGSKEPQRLTLDPAEDEWPVWSPTGAAIAYTSADSGSSRRILWQEAHSGSRPNLVRTWPNHAHVTSWSPDGKWLALYEFTLSRSVKVSVISIDGQKTIPVGAATFKPGGAGAEFSPDGKWLAYTSEETQALEVFLVSFPTMDIRRQVTSSGGAAPHWDAAGHLYYLSGNNLAVQSIDLATGVSMGAPSILFSCPPTVFNFNATRDGQRFLLQVRNPHADHPPLRVRTNWFDEIRARLK